MEPGDSVVKIEDVSIVEALYDISIGYTPRATVTGSMLTLYYILEAYDGVDVDPNRSLKINIPPTIKDMRYFYLEHGFMDTTFGLKVERYRPFYSDAEGDPM